MKFEVLVNKQEEAKAELTARFVTAEMEYKKKRVDFENGARILKLGAGEAAKFTPEMARELGAMAAAEAKAQGLESLALQLSGIGPVFAGAACEGALLAAYAFDGFKSKKEKNNPVKIIACCGTAEEKAAKKAGIVAQNVMLARDLANSPPNTATPSFIAAAAKKAAGKKITVTVLEKADLKKNKMGAFYAVAQGTEEPAKLVIMEYKGNNKNVKPVVFIGKGITFDSGGISLKPSAGIEDMKFDMSGAAAVIMAVKTAADLGLKINITALMPLTENLPDGKAYKPSDVLTTMSGKTVEVISTDAEGRLILCDTMTYALKKFSPEIMIDIATLTGACSAAFGSAAAGVMGNDENTVALLKECGEITGERLWELPLWDEYRDMIKSKTADIKNTGGKRAGAITAGMFLKEFAQGVKWAHLDIAGTAYNMEGKAYAAEGASGFGVRLLLEFAEKKAEGK
ncbi:MAG TPA: leucyl aminopeptidase [Candidatus Goldiibacteriota bacterium]|nr:leucyl aminopeptidase [Candidatus Goldiibacteriota bacterium]